MQQLKAFTLLELLVAMAITGIVVSIAGLAFSLLDKQVSGYRSESALVNSVFALHGRMQRDIMDAASVNKDEQDIIIERRNRTVIKYTFGDKYVLFAANERTDTFFVAAENIKAFFMQEEAEGLIDELYFEAKVNDQKETFHYTKQYTAGELMNREEQDGN